MRKLRSRWTVVALVPAFFLAGFGIVSALAGGSDDSPQAGAQGQTTDGAAGEGVTMIGSTTDAATTSAPATSVPTTTTTSPTTTSNNGDNGGGNGGGRPPAPPRGTIAIDYGQWEGMFEIASPEIVPEFGMASVNGELRYFGGVDCTIHRVVVRGWFYSGRGQFIGPLLWESALATGDGGEVTGREGLPFEAYGNVSELPESAALKFTKVEC